MNPNHSPPPQWRHLFTENGKIDPFLLTSLGSSGEAAFQLYAVCGRYCETTSVTELVVVLHKNDVIVLVGGLPAVQVYGSPLSHDDLVTTIQFIARNQIVLLAHWVGAIDSIELAMRVVASNSL